MRSRKRPRLVLAVHFQPRGLAFVLFAGSLLPVDWGVFDPRGANKNTLCLKRIDTLFALHTPDILLLRDASDRNRRIRALSRGAAQRAARRGIVVRTYSRAQINQHFEELGTISVTKHRVAEQIAQQIPSLSLYLPPHRKPWMSEDPRMGIFDAAALGSMFFRSIDQGT